MSERLTSTESMYKNISYFRGLNTLRFIAAFLVLMHHGEGMKGKYGLTQLNSLSLFSNGGNAVTFFFVLSGFLITYLLLKEKKATNTVSIKKFYLKRVLRIWPLYFLLVFIGTVVLPVAVEFAHLDYDIPYSFTEVWHYFVFFFPCLVTFYYGHHLLEPLWSIGVEEVFYLIWAPLFKFVKKNILAILLGVIFIKTIMQAIPLMVEMPAVYTMLVNTLSFEAMAIGGLGAYFIFTTRKTVGSQIYYRKPIQILVYILLFVFLFFNKNIDNVVWKFFFATPILGNFVVNLIFIYLILGVSVAENKVLKLENKIFSYLGEISYGIYMYHMSVLVVVILLLQKIAHLLHPIAEVILFYGLTTIGVILVSHLSKKYFEDYFLRLKSRLH